MKISPEVLKQHPLPWAVKLVGRDTSRGVCVINDAKGELVLGGHYDLSRDIAQLIVWSVNGMQEVNKVVSDYNNGTMPGDSTYELALRAVDTIINILRGD